MTILNKRAMARHLGEILTPAQVAEALKLSERTVIRHMQSGRLPGVKIGSVWRCSRERLEHFLRTGALTLSDAEAS